MTTLQQTLVNSTRSLHDRIENNPLMHALQHHEPLEIPYQWLLKKLYPFALLGERQLTACLHPNEGFEMTPRCRAHLLLNDLAQMHITPQPAHENYFDAINTTGKAIGLL